jgi:hypothetical protein
MIDSCRGARLEAGQLGDVIGGSRFVRKLCELAILCLVMASLGIVSIGM